MVCSAIALTGRMPPTDPTTPVSKPSAQPPEPTAGSTGEVAVEAPAAATSVLSKMIGSSRQRPSPAADGTVRTEGSNPHDEQEDESEVA